jgi:hypothetical protein
MLESLCRTFEGDDRLSGGHIIEQFEWNSVALRARIQSDVGGRKEPRQFLKIRLEEIDMLLNLQRIDQCLILVKRGV